jgi:hypothetical protein
MERQGVRKENEVCRLGPERILLQLLVELTLKETYPEKFKEFDSLCSGS